MSQSGSKISTCLWFAKDGEAAAKLYTSLVPNSEITEVMRSPVDYPGGEAGDVLTVTFTLDGAQFMALNGGTQEAYGTAASIMVSCENQAEVDRLWAALTEGGKEIQCGWLNDRWGVPWQVVPRQFMELMTAGDAAGKKRLMEAMMQMVKFDVAKLESAAAG